MRIAYLISHDINKNDGVTKKILGQTIEWQSLGHEVQIYSFVTVKGDSILSEAKQYLFKGALKLRFKLDKSVLNHLDSFNPHIVYFRYNTWSRTLSKVIDKYNTIAELNTLDLGEMWLLFKRERTIKSFLRYWGYRFFRSLVLSNICGIVAVTKEIAEHSTNLKFNKPTLAVPNGINLSEYSLIKDVNNISPRIGLAFIGTDNRPWHGVDVIEKIALNLPQYDFHIIGMEGINSNNLFWYGFLDEKEYIEIFKICHICIGTLALHRKNMYEACPLKVREYLAYGYPIIIGYVDTAFNFKELPRWVKYLEVNQEIDFEELSQFIEKNHKIIVDRNEIENISTQKLELKRLDFFSSIFENKDLQKC